MASPAYGDNIESKRPIAETPYVRSRYPKKFCAQCNVFPEGFRGQNELARHISRAHQTSRKVWICVDASVDQKFLAKCKACRGGKKYGAYYNAAAHLQRVHFNPLKKGRATSSPDAPSMAQLKKSWMREVEEALPESSDEQQEYVEEPAEEPFRRADDYVNVHNVNHGIYDNSLDCFSLAINNFGDYDVPEFRDDSYQLTGDEIYSGTLGCLFTYAEQPSQMFGAPIDATSDQLSPDFDALLHVDCVFRSDDK